MRSSPSSSRAPWCRPLRLAQSPRRLPHPFRHPASSFNQWASRSSCTRGRRSSSLQRRTSLSAFASGTVRLVRLGGGAAVGFATGRSPCPTPGRVCTSPSGSNRFDERRSGSRRWRFAGTAWTTPSQSSEALPAFASTGRRSTAESAARLHGATRPPIRQPRLPATGPVGSAFFGGSGRWWRMVVAQAFPEHDLVVAWPVVLADPSFFHVTTLAVERSRRCEALDARRFDQQQLGDILTARSQTRRPA